MASCTKISNLLVICYRLHVWLMWLSAYYTSLGIGLKRWRHNTVQTEYAYRFLNYENYDKRNRFSYTNHKNSRNSWNWTSKLGSLKIKNRGKIPNIAWKLQRDGVKCYVSAHISHLWTPHGVKFFQTLTIKIQRRVSNLAWNVHQDDNVICHVAATYNSAGCVDHITPPFDSLHSFTKI